MRTAKPIPSRKAAPSLVHEFLEISAALYPEKAAVVHEGNRAVYAGINDGANRLAVRLSGGGVRPGDRVEAEVEGIGVLANKIVKP